MEYFLNVTTISVISENDEQNVYGAQFVYSTAVKSIL